MITSVCYAESRQIPKKSSALKIGFGGASCCKGVLDFGGLGVPGEEPAVRQEGEKELLVKAGTWQRGGEHLDLVVGAICGASRGEGGD